MKPFTIERKQLQYSCLTLTRIGTHENLTVWEHITGHLVLRLKIDLFMESTQCRDTYFYMIKFSHKQIYSLSLHLFELTRTLLSSNEEIMTKSQNHGRFHSIRLLFEGGVVATASNISAIVS